MNEPKTTDLAAKILSEAGKPLHYIALTHELLRRGIRLRGKTPWMTLRTALMTDGRFERVGEKTRTGMYALASWSSDKKRVSREEILSERRKAAAYREQARAAQANLLGSPSAGEGEIGRGA